MPKLCSDESKCAVMKGCLCSDKKVFRKFGWINKKFLVKRSFRNWSPAFAIEMCNCEFSFKHALPTLRGVHPPKPMMHIPYSPISTTFIISPLFQPNLYISPCSLKIYGFCLIYAFYFPYFDHDALMSHALTYWTPLPTQSTKGCPPAWSPI